MLRKFIYQYLLIFTDGSKDSNNNHVGVGVYIPEFDINICKRIKDATETARDNLLNEILTIMLRIERLGIDVQFCWALAHVGVEGNEIADLTALIP